MQRDRNGNEGSIPFTRSNKYGLFLAFTMF